ncbi:MAG: glycoside hydrolase family 3 protein, partial [Candidatus Eremiobacteraeota bacterium]|nr:glycoside hydrolase family 3 protein [Candidatus Eremiobacteraeota bacterium]
MDDLESRLSGLILAGFDGTALSRETAQFIAGTAGTVLFGRNLATPDSTRALVDELQSARPPSRPPLLVATDQEGDPVSRLDALGSHWPSAMALGAVGDASLTRAVYRCMGTELRALGITVDFAPVADVNTNPANPVIGLRSFGGDAAAVSVHVDAAIRGLHDAGVAATAKHFPGHGDTGADSHFEAVATEQTEHQIREIHLAPFRAAIEAGVEMVMTGHVSAPALDASGAPATLSRNLLTDLLRGQLGFEGVICTDDMEMRGLEAGDDAAVVALDAGADLLLFAGMERARRALERIRRAMSQGRLEAPRLHASLARVDALRAVTRIADASAAAGDGVALTREVARRSIAIVRARGGVPPFVLTPGARVLIVNFIEGGASRATGARVESALGVAIAAAGYRAT